MRRIKRSVNKLRWINLPKIAVVLFLGGFCLSSVAQQPGQRTFSSAEEASRALVAAMQSDDEKAMLGLLGSDGKQIISSGDETEDAHSRANFVEKYREMHRLVNEPDGTTTLYIGARNWPTPIPLMRKGGSWYFDTELGKKEILYRRVGRNELSAITVCQELVAAENDYHRTQHDEYAKRINSDDGKHNGLYWQAAVGEPQSPIGPLVASAVAEGYDEGKNVLVPYRGYYFRILSLQGKNGPGGAKSYILNGKMTEGYAFVAFPAQYRSSGVMTFIVGGDGVVYEKDLGKDTSVAAKVMKKYDPDATWHKAEEAQATARESETN
jgi:Protein of unknown function (DUF2950)